MWDADEAVSNGTFSDAKPSPLNGTVQCDGNSMSAAATGSSSMAGSSENHSTHNVTSKIANEKTALLNCVIASDISTSDGAACSSADTVAKPSTTASVNCCSVTRTSRHLYSDHVTDNDGCSVNNTDRNASSTPNHDASEPVCVDYISTNGLDPRSSSSQTSYHISHNSAHLVSDSMCPASEQVLVAAENSSSTAVVDLTETLAAAEYSDFCDDDGYMDEVDVTALCVSDVHQHGHGAAWFVETDACLDDFIDADMPHSNAVAGSPSSSSLSSFAHDELTGMPENGGSNAAERVADDVTVTLKSDVSIDSQRLSHGSPSSDVERYGTVASSCLGFSHGDSNSLHDQCATCNPVLQMPPSHAGRCLELGAETARISCGVNIRGSNQASESSHETPPTSLPSPAYDYDSYAEPLAAAFHAASADEQVFKNSTLAGSSSSDMRKSSDTSETCNKPAGLKQNQYYWLPIDVESDFPKFGCWSCMEVMNNASSGLPAAYVKADRPHVNDIMWRSATEDYSVRDWSDLFADGDECSAASVLSSRMSSSLTL